MRSLPTPDGLTLALHEHGGTGRPTLLCHATGFHGAVWEPLSSALGDGFERWALDFRAHGASTVPEGQRLEWSEIASDVLTAVDALGVEPGRLLGVGHSMGGACLLLAEQARPGTFAGLWLFEPIAPPAGALPPARRWQHPGRRSPPPAPHVPVEGRGSRQLRVEAPVQHAAGRRPARVRPARVRGRGRRLRAPGLPARGRVAGVPRRRGPRRLRAPRRGGAAPSSWPAGRTPSVRRPSPPHRGGPARRPPRAAPPHGPLRSARGTGRAGRSDPRLRHHPLTRARGETPVTTSGLVPEGREPDDRAVGTTGGRGKS